MKKLMLLSIVALLSIGCVPKSQHDELLNKCDSLCCVIESERAVIRSLEERVASLTDSVIMFSYLSCDR